MAVRMLGLLSVAAAVLVAARLLLLLLLQTAPALTHLFLFRPRSRKRGRLMSLPPNRPLPPLPPLHPLLLLLPLLPPHPLLLQRRGQACYAKLLFTRPRSL